MTRVQAVRVRGTGINKEGVAVTLATIGTAASLFYFGLNSSPETHLTERQNPTPEPEPKPTVSTIHPDTKIAIETFSRRSKSEALIGWLKNLGPGTKMSLRDCSKELVSYGDYGIGGLVATTNPERGNYVRDVPGEEGKIIGALPKWTAVSFPGVAITSYFGSSLIWAIDAHPIDNVPTDISQRPTFTLVKAGGANPIIYMNIIRGDVRDCPPATSITFTK